MCLHCGQTLITHANIETLREMLKMDKFHPAVIEVIKEAGLADEFIARGEAIGEARGKAIGEARGKAIAKELEALAIAQNMVNLGFPLDTIVAATMLDPEKVRPLFQKSKEE